MSQEILTDRSVRTVGSCFAAKSAIFSLNYCCGVEKSGRRSEIDVQAALSATQNNFMQNKISSRQNKANSWQNNTNLRQNAINSNRIRSSFIATLLRFCSRLSLKHTILHADRWQGRVLNKIKCPQRLFEVSVFIWAQCCITDCSHEINNSFRWNKLQQSFHLLYTVICYFVLVKVFY